MAGDAIGDAISIVNRQYSKVHIHNRSHGKDTGRTKGECLNTAITKQFRC